MRGKIAWQREVGAILPFQPSMPLFLAVIWAFGYVFPAGVPGMIEVRKGEISGSAWPFLFLLFFLQLFFLSWMSSQI